MKDMELGAKGLGKKDRVMHGLRLADVGTRSQQTEVRVKARGALVVVAGPQVHVAHELALLAPDVPVTRIMWGTIPYVICMMLQIVILCMFPEIATWLPDTLMGPSRGGR